MEERLTKIEPQFGKETFLRKAWISLAKDDVPLDVFNLDLSEVTEEQSRVLFTSANYRTTWTAEIGNDRQESYVDFETYYEKIPYTDYETRYNSTTRQQERVPVTKYRQEQRQRQVTKYRTVTDWHSGNGEHSGHESYINCVDRSVSFDKRRFLDDFELDYLTDLSDAERIEQNDMQITSDLMDMAYDIQLIGIESETRRSMPGDHANGFSFNVVEFAPEFAILMKVPEYKVTLSYEGSTYEKRGFAFGDMSVSESGIPNPISVEEEKRKLEAKTRAEIKTRNDAVEPKVWNATKILSLASVGLLGLSIVFSLFIKVLFLVVVAFLGAVGLFIASKLIGNATRERIEKETRAANTAAEQACAEAVRDYERVHKAQLLEALNNKLATLGFAPADMNELDAV